MLCCCYRQSKRQSICAVVVGKRQKAAQTAPTSLTTSSYNNTYNNYTSMAVTIGRRAMGIIENATNTRFNEQ